MKKIILIILLFVAVKMSTGQSYTFTLTSTKVTLSSILDTLYGKAYTSMNSAVQYYDWSLQSTLDSVINVSRNSAGTHSGVTHSGENLMDYSCNDTDRWIWTSGGSYTVTVKLLKLIKSW